MDITARLDAMTEFIGGGPQKSEEEEIAELMALGINHPARKKFREREQAKKWKKLEDSWNRTPMRTRPAELRGLQPRTPEPWAIDEKYYQKKTGSFEHQYNARAPYDDRSAMFEPGFDKIGRLT